MTTERTITAAVDAATAAAGLQAELGRATRNAAAIANLSTAPGPAPVPAAATGGPDGADGGGGG